MAAVGARRRWFRLIGIACVVCAVVVAPSVQRAFACPGRPVGSQSIERATVTWYRPSADVAAWWTVRRLGIAASDRDVHADLVDADIASLSDAWEGPEGSAVESEGGVLPQAGIFLFVDKSGGMASCSGAVVESPWGNRVLSAAHCFDWAAGAVAFVPDYHDGQAPYGVWPVRAVAVDSRYGSVPAGDLAVAEVADVDGRRLADVVGALPLADEVELTTQRLVMAGYPALTREPRLCAASTTAWREADDEFLHMECGDMPSGVSGGPWVSMDGDGEAALVGVTGGAQDGGGYSAAESVAVPVDDDVRGLVAADFWVS